MASLSADHLPASPSRRRLLLASPKDYIISPQPVSQTPLASSTVIELRLYTSGLKGEQATLTLSEPILLSSAFITKVQSFVVGDNGWVTKSFIITGQERYILLNGLGRTLSVELRCGNLSTTSEPFALDSANDCDCGAPLKDIFLTDSRNDGFGPRFGGTQWADEFEGWTQMIQDGRSTRNEQIIITAVSLNEGRFDAMQSLDSEILSVGIMQKTLSLRPDMNGGQLAKQLYEFAQANPARYNCLLGNCGWEVTLTNGVYQASYTKPGTTHEYKRDDLKTKIRAPHQRLPNHTRPPATAENELLEPFVRLLQDKVFQEKQVLDFLSKLNELLDKKPVDASNYVIRHYTYKTGEYLKGNLGIALLLDQYINKETQAMSYLGKALTRFYNLSRQYWQNLNASDVPSNDPNSWTTHDRPIYEKEIVKIYGPLRGATIETSESGAGLFFKGINDANSRFNNIRCYFLREQKINMDWLPALPEKGKIPECTNKR